MSRKKPSVNLPSDSPSKIEQSEVSVREGKPTCLQRLVAKINLNQLVIENRAGKLTKTDARGNLLKNTYLRGIQLFLSKLRWDQTSSYDLEQVRRNILSDIGNQLYQARREQNISLEAIAADTLISPGLLKSLEKGILEGLPEPIYVRGLIKKFADYLGLNGKVLASRFPTNIATKSSKSSQSSSIQIWFPKFELRPLHLYFIYIVIVILSVEGISNHLKRTVLELETGKVYKSSPRSSSSVTIYSDQNSYVNQRQKDFDQKVW